MEPNMYTPQPKPEIKPAGMTARKAAEYIGVSEKNMWLKINAGEVPTVRFGHRRIVPVRFLDQLLESAA
jgi:hypothetical protein